MICPKCGAEMELVRRSGLVRDYLIKECSNFACRHHVQDEEIVNLNRREV
jgi:Zn-finger nucleic acid-binding protein